MLTAGLFPVVVIAVARVTGGEVTAAMAINVEAGAERAVLKMLGADGRFSLRGWSIPVDHIEASDHFPVGRVSLNLSPQDCVAGSLDHNLQHVRVGHVITTSPVIGGPGQPQLGVP